jgi:hypothetical protein
MRGRVGQGGRQPLVRAEHQGIEEPPFLVVCRSRRWRQQSRASLERPGQHRSARPGTRPPHVTIPSNSGKIVTIPLAPRRARAVDLAIGERAAAPIFTAIGGPRLDRHSAARIVRRGARRAGSPDRSGRTPCATPSLPPPSTGKYRCTRPRSNQPRRSSYHHGLRPAPPELQPPRRLRRRGLRHGRITGGQYRHHPGLHGHALFGYTAWQGTVEYRSAWVRWRGG